MRKIILFAFIGFFLVSIGSVSAASLICGAGSSGVCPTAGTECTGNTGVCTYKNCSCVVATGQTIDSNQTYYFSNFTLNPGVTITVSTHAAGGNNANGNNGPCRAGGGAGGTCASAGGSYAGGGGESGYGKTGGSYCGGGGGGGGWVGGAGGGRLDVYANFIIIAGTITANGGAGSGSYAGGGGGGNINLFGNAVNINGGTINAIGGSSGGSGGGGGGGFINITYSCQYTAGTYNVGGGSSGCAAGGTGSAGSVYVSGGLDSQLSVLASRQSLNITLRNQSHNVVPNAKVSIFYAGTNNCFCCNGTTSANGFFGVGTETSILANNSIFDVNITTTSYKQDIKYKSARAPDRINATGNKKWIPQTNLTESRLFTAGHVVPVSMYLLSPYSWYNVSNISIEDWVPTSTRIVSNIIVERFNSTGRTVCDVVPDNSTYFYIDKTDCPFLAGLNVTNKDWLKINYRIRIPGPENYTSIGDVKMYTLPIAYLRFDIAT